jgi:hypothetical protein
MVVTAVRAGLINVAEACARYNITIEEFLSWKRLLDEHGFRGLRATCLQKYRHSAKSEGMADAESADVGAVRYHPKLQRYVSPLVRHQIAGNQQR